MFPSQQPNYSNSIRHDLIVQCHDDGLMGASVNPTASTSNERPTPFKVHQEEANIGVINVRKYVHREIERQRRQEMANLCGSLRTLLPPQYTMKGTRSMPDLMQQSANYIKDMQKSIQQLKTRRDNLIIRNGPNSDNITSRENLPNDCVRVNPCPGGVEILINTSFDEGQGFPLSRILKELSQTGLDVVSCVSTRANQRSLHRIQSEARRAYSVEDLAALQERLSQLPIL
ncbi:Transcription factor [Sesamum angolense]|uniref:Transcription factor n=1 Tax=Sesamum angolense TaxID=2727404 RepID=A0AAE2BZW3_9LAMI|nr:Transcription factor [Sesamum angolense]